MSLSSPESFDADVAALAGMMPEMQSQQFNQFTNELTSFFAEVLAPADIDPMAVSSLELSSLTGTGNPMYHHPQQSFQPQQLHQHQLQHQLQHQPQRMQQQQQHAGHFAAAAQPTTQFVPTAQRAFPTLTPQQLQALRQEQQMQFQHQIQALQSLQQQQQQQQHQHQSQLPSQPLAPSFHQAAAAVQAPPVTLTDMSVQSPHLSMQPPPAHQFHVAPAQSSNSSSGSSAGFNVTPGFRFGGSSEPVAAPTLPFPSMVGDFKLSETTVPPTPPQPTSNPKPRGKPATEQADMELKRSHILSEQKRRDNIKEGFGLLKDVVPTVKDSCSRAAILKKTVDYIELLKRQNRQLANRLQGQAETEEISFDALVEAIEKKLHIRANVGEGGVKLMYKDEGRVKVDVTSQEDLDDVFQKFARRPGEFAKLSLYIKKPGHVAPISTPLVAEDVEQLVLANDALVNGGGRKSSGDTPGYMPANSPGLTTHYAPSPAGSTQGSGNEGEQPMSLPSFGDEDEDEDEEEDDMEDATIRPQEIPLDMDILAVNQLHTVLASHPGMSAGAQRMRDVEWQRAKVYRFLVACKGNVPLAHRMLEAHFAWLQSYHPERITEADCANELRANKLYWHGFDRYGHPCLLFKANRHFVSKRDKYETIRHWVLMVQDFVEHRAIHPFQQFVFIYDRTGAGRANSDVPMLKKFVRMFQQNYPELLHCMYVLNADFVFRYGFSVVKRFTSKSFRRKIKLLGENWKDFVLRDFEPQCLQVEYGGTSPLVYNYQDGQAGPRRTGW
ncbi:hypothetical protein CAOG_06016 [Capsaspora owczarzaki ATCC 30864]|uniref:BHLH domain-containing protein n=1 Tax=Capsaspora owczarzaki (strain ATCC 30864) TaxID=595528 RepID=A0A0D2WT83_CAPO3|nr:hypothetical protein CAOG_06016 [Capsaspora owczarzaki ATCC 30864]KJE95575.1 hypothetical protein, variant [Capsaspora owczarzaki ATCC 30864]|eukprot:XP_004345606.2 hypothetical protein CAOG_06016 [Capsaspora owczarzaki ATCC 30864]